MFYGKNIRTDEEYKKEIIKRMVIFSMILLLGIITIVIALMGKYYEKFNFEINSIWYFMGMGCGLIFAALVNLIRDYILIKNKYRLRKERIKNSDERNIEISIKASRVTTAVILVMLYITIIVSGFVKSRTEPVKKSL